MSFDQLRNNQIDIADPDAVPDPVPVAVVAVEDLDAAAPALAGFGGAPRRKGMAVPTGEKVIFGAPPVAAVVAVDPDAVSEPEAKISHSVAAEIDPPVSRFSDALRDSLKDVATGGPRIYVVEDAGDRVLVSFPHDEVAVAALRDLPSADRSFDGASKAWSVAKSALTEERVAGMPDGLRNAFLQAGLGIAGPGAGPIEGAATGGDRAVRTVDGMDMSDINPSVAVVIERQLHHLRQQLGAMNLDDDAIQAELTEHNRALVEEILPRLSTIQSSRRDYERQMEEASQSAIDNATPPGILTRLFGGMLSVAASRPDFSDDEQAVMRDLGRINDYARSRAVDVKETRYKEDAKRTSSAAASVDEALVNLNAKISSAPAYGELRDIADVYASNAGVSLDQVLRDIGDGKAPEAISGEVDRIRDALRADLDVSQAQAYLEERERVLGDQLERQLKSAESLNVSLPLDDPRRIDMRDASDVSLDTIFKSGTETASPKPLMELGNEDRMKRLTEMAERIRKTIERILNRLFGIDHAPANDQGPAQQVSGPVAAGMAP